MFQEYAMSQNLLPNEVGWTGVYDYDGTIE
jgi:hypothetical protein